MSGYLLLLVTLGASSLFLVPKEAKAIDVCLVAGACFTREACEEIAGAEFRACGQLCSADKKFGCGRCKTSEGYCFPPRKGIELAIHIGGTKRVYDTSQYLESVYDFAIGIAGGIAGVMLMIGGFQYLTAGGAADRVSAAKKRISDALVGLALVLGAFLLLNTISPDLVNMSELRVPMIQKKTYTACYDYVSKQICGQGFDLREKSNAADLPAGEKHTITPNQEGGICIGMNCKKAGANDVFFKCASSNPENKLSLGTPVKPYQCILCKEFGDKCTDLGASDQCCTGFCGSDASGGSGTCSSGEAGDKCEADNQCKSGVCQDATELGTLGNSCTEGKIGSPCGGDEHCKGGNRCQNNICAPRKEGAPCDDDGECPSGFNCQSVGQAGLAWSVCVPDSAGGTFTGFYTKCNLSLFDDNPCPSSASTCADFICTDKQIGSPCTGDVHCASGICVTDVSLGGKLGGIGAIGLCADGEIGSRCDGNVDCANARCFIGDNWGVCVSGKEWSGCDDRTDCERGLKCEPTSKRCIPE